MPAPFISRDDLADHLHMAAGSLETDEAALQAVDAACDWLRDLTGQTFNYVTDDVVLMDGTGTDALLLPELPVEEVSSVVVTGEEEFTELTYTLHDSGILMRAWETNEGFVNPLPYAACWPKGRNNVEVTYTHGYSDDVFPRSLRMLAVRLAAGFYQAPAGGVTFESLGQHSVRYAEGGPTALSTTEQLIVRRHTYHRQPSRVVT
jgi:hypothetical protein